MTSPKRAGRSARMRARQAAKPAQAIWPGLMGGAYKPLSQSDMEQIDQAAMTLLATLGVGDPTQELLDICLPQGAHVNQHGRLCFPQDLMAKLIQGAAKNYTVYARGERLGRPPFGFTTDGAGDITPVPQDIDVVVEAIQLRHQ
ncbi:MAG: trimethylamine methyltransferase family protein, partial [Gammaproteobacteria bacterium]|nr:trimethylamine methyltransferase family protein [Gammaproteobacteria bacterium]